MPRRPPPSTPFPYTTLFRSRMDFTIQKATELGVSEITPLWSERCEVRLKGERLEKKIQHWQNIAISACQQSGRCRSEEHTSELQSRPHLVCRLLLEKKKRSG